MGNVALVFAGGDRPPPRAVQDLPSHDLVVAADSGLDYARALGYAVNLVVGDLDSATPASIDAAVDAGATVERHAEAKDATDLELALLAVRDRGCTRVVVVGGHGGRVDHFLANALLLASPDLAEIHVEARLGDAQLYVVRDERELHGELGDLCTLLPLGGSAHGVRTDGLRFPLRAETLEPGSTRGVSNEFVASVARVSLGGGVLLAILPDPGRANR